MTAMEAARAFLEGYASANSLGRDFTDGLSDEVVLALVYLVHRLDELQAQIDALTEGG